MRRYFIRDDDTSYFTTIDQLELAYGDLWSYGPIGLAVIPFTVKTENHGEIGNQVQYPDKEYFIGDNKELVLYIKNLIKEKKVYIMLHGFNHYYRPSDDKTRYPFGIPEFIYTDNQYEKIKKAKEALENLFDIEIKWFIPPSNALVKETILACDKLNLNLPLLFPLQQRFFSTLLRNPLNFLINRLNLISTYNFPLSFKRHKEIRCTSYTSVTNFDSSYARHRTNMVIATHYWELLQYPGLKNRILEDIREYGYKIYSLNDL